MPAIWRPFPGRQRQLPAASSYSHAPPNINGASLARLLCTRTKTTHYHRRRRANFPAPGHRYDLSCLPGRVFELLRRRLWTVLPHYFTTYNSTNTERALAAYYRCAAC